MTSLFDSNDYDRDDLRSDTRSFNRGARTIMGRSILPWVLAIFAVLTVCGVGGFLVNSALYQNVVAPTQRQNINHNPNWKIQYANDFTSTYTDFQKTQQQLTTDLQGANDFLAAHPNHSDWTYLQWAEYKSDYDNVQGDYQAEQNYVSHYQSLLIDPDTRDSRPDDCPNSPLQPDSRPTLPSPGEAPMK